MQIINKKTNFTDGTVDLKLYQTGFAGLTKVLGNVAGQTVSNAVSEAYTGYQFFNNLNDLQLAMKPKLESVGTAYNIDINSKKSKVPALYNFSYNFNSIVNYKSGITEGTKADYKLLQLIVNPEKEMYDYKVFMSEHVKRNAEILKEWSKGRNYGATVSEISLSMQPETLNNNQLAVGGNGNIDVSYTWEKSKVWFRFSNLHNLKIGESRTIWCFVQWDVPGGDETNTYSKASEVTIKRVSLGNTSADDGYYTFTPKVFIENGPDGERWETTYMQDEPRITAYSGVASPHFITDSHDFYWFKTRKLI